MTCAEYGVKQAEGVELERIITESHCAEVFFDQCNEAAKGRAHAFVYWPEENDAEGAEE